MNRSRQRDRNRDRVGHGGYGGDGLLGEGPSGGNPIMNQGSLNLRESQLALAQSLLHQQQLVNAGLGGVGGGEFGGLGALAGGMHFLQQQQQQQMRGMSGGGGGNNMGGGMHGDRKRIGGQMRRDGDGKHRRRDSWGRGDKDRSRGSNRSGQDRDRSRPSRWEPDRCKDDGEDYDPAEPTEDDDDGNKTDSNLYCHVCNISVYDDDSFQRHLNGLRHKARMESILTAHQMKSTQLKSRLKAEEHLRNIERKGGRDPDFFCKICNNDLAIPWEKHRYSNIHKQRLLQVRKGCGWCKVYDFTNFTEVLEHRDTEEHKRNAELYGKKEEDKEDGSRSRSKEKKGEREPRRSSLDRGRKSKDDGDKKVKTEEEEEDLTIPEYNADTPVGLTYIIPVTGFFCKLCHKFYNNEKTAKGSHCQSETHYEKFQAAMEAKIAVREKEKAEKEERQMKQDEEQEKEQEAKEDNWKEGEDKEEREGEDAAAEDEEYAEEMHEESAEEKEEVDDEMLDEEEGEQLSLTQGNSTNEDEDMLEGNQEGDNTQSFLESDTAASFVYMAAEADQKPMGTTSEEPVVINETEELKGGQAADDSATAELIEDDSPKNAPASTPTPQVADDSMDLTAAIAGGLPSSTPKAESEVTPPTRGRASAKRGRGKGRAKK